MRLKNPDLHSFFKLLLGHVNVEIVLIFCHFLVGFFMHPCPTQWLTPFFFSKRKVLRWYISRPSFSHVWFAVPELSKFKYFQSSRKFDFSALLGSFLAITLPKCAPFLHGGWSQNMFAEVVDNFILLIYFSVEALRYIT